MIFNYLMPAIISIYLIFGVQAVKDSKRSLKCPPWSASLVEFSGSFQQPEPPKIQSEFQTSFIQHKWNADVSHVTQGYIINTPSKQRVRADEAFEGTLASSIFNYANVSQEGQVENILTSTTSSDLKNPEQFRGYMTPNFPLWAENSLQGAVFTGLVSRKFVPGKAASWGIMFQGILPVTVFVDSCDTIVGYDYFSPDLRTRVVTMYFNTILD